MPFGLCNTPAKLERLKSCARIIDLENVSNVYFDDVIVSAKYLGE